MIFFKCPLFLFSIIREIIEKKRLKSQENFVTSCKTKYPMKAEICRSVLGRRQLSDLIRQDFRHTHRFLHFRSTNLVESNVSSFPHMRNYVITPVERTEQRKEDNSIAIEID